MARKNGVAFVCHVDIWVGGVVLAIASRSGSSRVRES